MTVDDEFPDEHSHIPQETGEDDPKYNPEAILLAGGEYHRLFWTGHGVVREPIPEEEMTTCDQCERSMPMETGAFLCDDFVCESCFESVDSCTEDCTRCQKCGAGEPTRPGCPKCGSTSVGTREQILGHAGLDFYAGKWDHEGRTEMWWDTSESTHLECVDCEWSEPIPEGLSGDGFWTWVAETLVYEEANDD